MKVLDLQRSLPHAVAPIGVVAVASADANMHWQQRFDVKSCHVTIIGNNTNHAAS